MRGKVKDHDAIIEAINASPHKCIDKEIAKRFNCSYRLVIKLRYENTDVMFHKKKDRPKPVRLENINTNRVNYLQELKDMPYNVARILLAMKGHYLTLPEVKEMGQ